MREHLKADVHHVIFAAVQKVSDESGKTFDEVVSELLCRGFCLHGNDVFGVRVDIDSICEANDEGIDHV